MIGGTLKDESGRPLPSETVLSRASNGGRRQTAKTANDGAFRLQSPLAPGEKCIFYLVASNYVLDQKKPPDDFNANDMRARTWHETTVDPGKPVELTAIPRSRVLGRVLTDGGQPVAGAEVTLEHSAPNRMPTWMAFATSSTDANGEFKFEALHAVEDKIRACVADRVGSGFSDTLKLERGQDVRGVEIRLAPAGVVEGTVRDDQGKPAPGARVWLLGRGEQSRSQKSGNINEILADRTGRFRFLGVGPGDFTVEARFAERRPDPNARSAPFKVEPGARVEQDIVVH